MCAYFSVPRPIASLISVFCLWTVLEEPLFAQSSKEIVQFYGIVFHEDSLSGAIGTHIYHPTTHRGTSTDLYGYFSLPVAVGDTMTVSYQGYVPQQIVVHQPQGDSFSMLIYLKPDTIYLPTIEVTPYLSEAQFKAALLALNSSVDLYPLAYRAQRPLIRASSSVNYFYFAQQQQLQQRMRYNPYYLPITDIVLKPLIRSIRSSTKRRTRSSKQNR